MSGVTLLVCYLAYATITDWVTSTTEIYLSQFWRPEVQDLGASMVGFWGHLSFWLAGGYLLTMCSHGGEREK